MADATIVSVDQPPPSRTTDDECGLSVPPLDPAFFSQDLIDSFGAFGDNLNDIVGGDLDFDISFDDLYRQFSEDIDGLLNPDQVADFNSQPEQNTSFPQFELDADEFNAVYKSTSSELCDILGGDEFSGDRGFNGYGDPNYASPVLESDHISGNINVPSPESKGSNDGRSDNCGGDTKGLNRAESRGSGNCGSNVSVDSNNCVARSVSSSPNSNKSSVGVGVVNQIKPEEPSKNNVKGSLLKRKKGSDDLPSNTVESRINKYRKSDRNSEDSNKKENDNNGGISGEEEKRKARLIRNRESAQLSRQRKKHYVDELEDKVKMMHSTIQGLNAKISYFMAENATLRQQMVGGGGVPQLPPAAQVPHAMYPHPAMMYPWTPYAPPPYMMKPQGSQVPMLPIPRLKPQQPAQVPKVSKKVESKKKEDQKTKTKKVAGVSFLGLLFFFMLFGGLAPLVNMRYGGVRETLTGGESYVGSGFYENHRGRVLMLNSTAYGVKDGVKSDFNSESSIHCGQRGHDSGMKPNADDFGGLGNGSEPLVASLYVPRNDKLVKIDGNLIIHSVLASEKSLSSHGETGLAVPGDLSPSLPIKGVGKNGPRHPHLRALGSGSAADDSRKPKATDGMLQQWFREGLSGPMLSSGLCTEVFQFEVSPGAIIPASTTPRNTSEQKQNSTRLSKGMNRRILRGLPIPLPQSSYNVSQNKNSNGNNSVSPPMVVSVLVDPREAGDADVDGVMGTKSLSRIFVVVLVDSVKYVTYSCMLPFKGSAPHLVTT